MGVVSDGKKAYRLLRKALTSRSAVQRVRRTLAAQEPHEPGRYRVAVYFADGAVNMYQMRQWYRPLQGLAERWPVVVLSRSATGAEKLIEESGLPVAFVPTVRNLEKFLAKQDIRVVLYVNQNTRNFQMFRYGRRWHVFINHGESDKMYMTTNQFKAYDYALIAGDAARARLDASRTRYDRLEAERSDFHARVRAGYLGLAEAEPERFLVVDAGRPVEEIAGEIRDRLAGRV